jgi:addiction module HigA family antidote
VTTIKEVKGVRIPKDRAPTSPGEMLLEEFLKPLGMTQVELAKRIRVPYVRVNELVNGKRRVSPSTALRLAKAFGTSPEFWLNGQLALDLYRAINDKEEAKEVEKIEPIPR